MPVCVLRAACLPVHSTYSYGANNKSVIFFGKFHWGRTKGYHNPSWSSLCVAPPLTVECWLLLRLLSRAARCSIRYLSFAEEWRRKRTKNVHLNLNYCRWKVSGYHEHDWLIIATMKKINSPPSSSVTPSPAAAPLKRLANNQLVVSNDGALRQKSSLRLIK